MSSNDRIVYCAESGVALDAQRFALGCLSMSRNAHQPFQRWFKGQLRLHQLDVTDLAWSPNWDHRHINFVQDLVLSIAQSANSWVQAMVVHTKPLRIWNNPQFAFTTALEKVVTRTTENAGSYEVRMSKSAASNALWSDAATQISNTLTKPTGATRVNCVDADDSDFGYRGIALLTDLINAAHQHLINPQGAMLTRAQSLAMSRAARVLRRESLVVDTRPDEKNFNVWFFPQEARSGLLPAASKKPAAVEWVGPDLTIVPFYRVQSEIEVDERAGLELRRLVGKAEPTSRLREIMRLGRRA